jgi:hypothetical protein
LSSTGKIVNVINAGKREFTKARQCPVASSSQIKLLSELSALLLDALKILLCKEMLELLKS